MRRLKAEDYARAERFLSRNKDRYVINADIQHHWIGEEERFWYLRISSIGEKEFVVVDAATGEQTLAFDHAKIAAGLSAAIHSEIAAGQLPFTSFRFAVGGREIQFLFHDKLWTCQLETGTCSTDALQAAFDEALSPDGKWAAFNRKYDLWVRDTASPGTEFRLTYDGVQHYAYAGSPGSGLLAVSNILHPKPTPPQVIWSPDSRFIFTHRIDERRVEEMYLLQSVPEDGSVRPKLYTYRYALAGDEHLPLWEPVVLDTLTRHKVRIEIPPSICPPHTPIEKREVWWAANGKTLYILNRDRYLKSVTLQSVNPVTGNVERILREESDTIAHTNGGSVFDTPLVCTISNGDVIWYSQRDGWGHLYYYDRTGALRNRITGGMWAVRSIIRVDERNERIFFTASGREEARDHYEQRLYSVRFDGTGLLLITSEEADHGGGHNPFAAPRPDDLATEAETPRRSKRT